MLLELAGRLGHLLLVLVELGVQFLVHLVVCVFLCAESGSWLFVLASHSSGGGELYLGVGRERVASVRCRGVEFYWLDRLVSHLRYF